MFVNRRKFQRTSNSKLILPYLYCFARNVNINVHSFGFVCLFVLLPSNKTAVNGVRKYGNCGGGGES